MIATTVQAVTVPQEQQEQEKQQQEILDHFHQTTGQVVFSGEVLMPLVQKQQVEMTIKHSRKWNRLRLHLEYSQEELLAAINGLDKFDLQLLLIFHQHLTIALFGEELDDG